MKNYRPHILVAVVLAIALLTNWPGTVRNVLADLRFAWQSRAATGDVVVIAIDAPSIERIGVWPWPRRLHAELLQRLDAAGINDVAFDVDFSTPSDPASDRAFVEALRGAGGSTVLPAFKQPGADGTTYFNRPLPQFRDQAWTAVVNVAVEPDGLVRRYTFGQKLDAEFLPSMGAVLAGQFDANSPSFLIDFSIRSATIPKVSFIDVLRGDEATLKRLKGRKVIVGGTALELGDRFSTPNGGIVAGPVLQAVAAESILQGRVLHWTSATVTSAGLLLLALAMFLTWRRFSAGARAAALVVSAVAIEAAGFVLQANYPLVLDTALFHIAIVVYITAVALDEIDIRALLGRVAESRFQRIAMSLGDGLICTDANYLITVWNTGADAMFGYRAEDMIGKPFEAICAGSGNALSISEAARHSPGTVIEFDGRRSNGEVFPVEASFSGWQGTEGYQYGAILRDISVRKREAERIRYLAEHDTLTGLANRNTLDARLAAMIARAEAEGGELALLVVGLDGFQRINDTLGHANGDLVLRAVAERLKLHVGSNAIVARLSGDEFALAYCCADMAESVAALAERIRRAFDEPVQAATRPYRVKVSIGAAVYPAGGRTADELLSNSHIAFYRAKAIKRGGYVAFENSIRQELEQRLTLEHELAHAAERGEFELFYQPQVHLGDIGLVGAEALIRWHHPVRGLIPPGEFMSVVNSSGISDRIADWVLQTACRQARAWERAGHPLRVGINLSPSQLQSGDLARTVAEVLAATGVTPSLIELEVTEDILLTDEQRVLDTFLRIQKLGVRLVFDDFGTGFASLSYLKKFPLDGLKIDRSFVRDLLTDSDDAAIVSSTISLGKQLGLSVIAEGIENRATAELLATMGCEEGQGYFFGKPMPVAALEEQFEQFMAAKRTPEKAIA
ncbi:EAL domain-containing protein [Bradyrhizobium sp.]|uniref:EAL domain-containing protein n=1 Tax=Bradyrhizobium sp. TaxID=376 RepID=UPI001DCD5A75|nr:EAL domain-containing protein [Bradyrhizobium sp.]MBI5318795.1 EAL domain-containing protein [Bradyrhizobium sp.]